MRAMEVIKKVVRKDQTPYAEVKIRPMNMNTERAKRALLRRGLLGCAHPPAGSRVSALSWPRP